MPLESALDFNAYLDSTTGHGVTATFFEVQNFLWDSRLGLIDTWYDIDDNQLKVYRETSSGVFEWVPIMIGNISDDSDTLDAGAF